MQLDYMFFSCVAFVFLWSSWLVLMVILLGCCCFCYIVVVLVDYDF